VPVLTCRARHAAFAAALLAVLAGAGCGGGSSASTPPVSTKPQPFPPPDIAAFLRNPVATPSACPSRQPASASGLGSPWVGHVDISVFLDTGTTSAQARRIGTTIRHAPGVATVYFESQDEAYAEFQRLYTCWARVSKSQTPASYRVALRPTVRIDARNQLVARFARLPHVDSVSCDPSLPCVNVVRSAHPG
jgi:hypothetical protein